MANEWPSDGQDEVEPRMRQARTIAAGGRMIRRPAAAAMTRHTRTETAGRAAHLLQRVAASPARARAERPTAPIGLQIGRTGAAARVQAGRLSLPASRALRIGAAA